jgi:hypothetical protein
MLLLQTGGIRKNEVLVASNSITLILNVMKIRPGVLRLTFRTHRWKAETCPMRVDFGHSAPITYESEKCNTA